MENKAIEGIAYHEAGRVVFAYLNGYTCDSMELPGSGSGGGSKLNSGNDASMVQAIFTGNTTAVLPAQTAECVEVAKKLMTITCAGSCAEIFYDNNGEAPDELDMEMPGADFRQVEKIQEFLKKNDEGYREDYPNQTMLQIFEKLKDKSVWKAITMLSGKMQKLSDESFSRFQVEDTLMAAGMSIRKPFSNSAGMGVHESDSRKAAPIAGTSALAHTASALSFDLAEASPLHIVLKDFLQRIKKDWREDELRGAVNYLDEVYRKYGG